MDTKGKVNKRKRATTPPFFFGGEGQVCAVLPIVESTRGHRMGSLMISGQVMLSFVHDLPREEKRVKKEKEKERKRASDKEKIYMLSKAGFFFSSPFLPGVK